MDFYEELKAFQEYVRDDNNTHTASLADVVLIYQLKNNLPIDIIMWDTHFKGTAEEWDECVPWFDLSRLYIIADRLDYFFMECELLAEGKLKE